MTTIRLPNDLEKKLNDIASLEHTTKSEIIKKALLNYFEEHDNSLSPYEAGEEYFGKYGSGKSNLSKDYKKLLKDKISDKYSH